MVHRILLWVTAPLIWAHDKPHQELGPVLAAASLGAATCQNSGCSSDPPGLESPPEPLVNEQPATNHEEPPAEEPRLYTQGFYNYFVRRRAPSSDRRRHSEPTPGAPPPPPEPVTPSSSPGPHSHGWRFWWETMGGWFKGGMTICGWVCTTLGFAARWTWHFTLLAASVALANAMYLIYRWVIMPVTRICTSVYRYAVGRQRWSETAPEAGGLQV